MLSVEQRLVFPQTGLQRTELGRGAGLRHLQEPLSVELCDPQPYLLGEEGEPCKVLWDDTWLLLLFALVALLGTTLFMMWVQRRARRRLRTALDATVTGSADARRLQLWYDALT